MNSLLFLLSILSDKEYYQEYNPYLFEENVIDCLFKMYMIVLTNKNSVDYQKRLNEFKEAYNILDEDKQNFICQEFDKIIDTQIKNDNEKILKKKGMI